jgi:hypothetical protein
VRATSLDILLARGDAVMRPESGLNPNADRRYRIYYDKDGVPVSVRDLMPFYEDRFEDEAGYEVLERYYLVFDFEAGGLMAEVTRAWTDAEFCGEYSYGFVELDRLNREVREALIRSGRLDGMRMKVLEAAREALTKIAQMTDLSSDAFQQGRLEEEVYRIFEQAIAGINVKREVEAP